MRVPVVLVNPGEVAAFTTITGGQRKLFRELYDDVRRRVMAGQRLRDVKDYVWNIYGEKLSEATIRKIGSPTQTLLRKDAQGNPVPLPTSDQLAEMGAVPMAESPDARLFMARQVPFIVERMTESLKARVMRGDITEAEIDRMFPKVFPSTMQGLASKLAVLKSVLKVEMAQAPGDREMETPEYKVLDTSEIEHAVTRRNHKQPLHGGINMGIDELVADALANPAIAEIAMNPGYAFPSAFVSKVVSGWRGAGAPVSKIRAGVKKLLRRAFGSKGRRWAENKAEMARALDSGWPGRPKRALPPGFVPFRKGDPRIAEYRARAKTRRPVTAGLATLQEIRNQLKMAAPSGKGQARLANAIGKLSQAVTYIPKHRARKPAVPSLAFAPAISSYVGARPRSKVIYRNPGYRGSFWENMVDTAVEGTAMAIPGILAIKGASYIADNWTNKIKFFQGSDGKANFWGRVATSVVVASFAGAAARRVFSKVNIGGKNVGELAGNGLAMGVMLYALSGIKFKNDKAFVTIEGNVGQADDTPVIVVDGPAADVKPGQALLAQVAAYRSNEGPGMYAARGEDEGHAAEQVAVQSGQPLV